MQVKLTPIKKISFIKILIFSVLFAFVSENVKAEYYLVYSFGNACPSCHHPKHKKSVKKHYAKKKITHKRRSHYCVSVYYPIVKRCHVRRHIYRPSYDCCGPATCDGSCRYRIRKHICNPCGNPYGYWKAFGYKPTHDLVVFSQRKTSWRGTTGKCDDVDMYYNPDMSTGDDYPTIYPDMNIDR